MTWEERITGEARYTPPSGGEPIVFTYDNFSGTVEKRTTKFEFPNTDGTFVQDLGRSGRKCPINAIFHGPDCDLEAVTFENALYERGAGVLDHPVYGRLTVVPFGAIQRLDNLKTRANVTSVQVTFWEVADPIIQLAATNISSTAVEKVKVANEKVSEHLNETLETQTVEEYVATGEILQSTVNTVGDAIRAVANTLEDVQRRYEAIEASILRSIDTLVGTPLAMAAQVQALVEAPARAADLIQAKFDAYHNLFSTLTGGEPKTPGLDNQTSNEFHLTDTFASAVVIAMVDASLNTEFTTAPQAIAASDSLLETFEALTVWRDTSFETLDQNDLGTSYQALQEMVTVTAGYLVQISFDAAQERIEILDRDSTIVEVCARLYGEVDERLDFFISSNSFSGAELLELPKGRKIVYYA